MPSHIPARSERGARGVSLCRQGGNAVLSAIVLMAVVFIASVTAVRRFGDTKEGFRIARVRSLMEAVESQVRARTLEPEAYLGCTGGGAGCHVNETFFADLKRIPVSGAACPAAVPKCGVLLNITGLDLATKTFHASVAYEGTEVKPKAIALAAKVPVEVLQTDVFQCGLIDPDRPVFAGFDAAGAPVCKGFNACGPGEYVRQIHASSRTLSCKALPATASCGAQQMISGLQFTGSSLTHSCADLPAPPYDNPTVTLGGCSANELLAAKKSMIQEYNENIQAVAQNCIDPATPTLAQNMPTTPMQTLRFMNTCGRRWCMGQKGFYTGRGIELNTEVLVECRQKSPPATVSAACQQVLQAAPPVFTISTTVTAVAQNCIDAAVPNLADNMPHDVGSNIRFVNTCGNRFCTKDNYASGRVVEYIGDTAEVECYDAKVETSGGEVVNPVETVTVAKDLVRNNCVDGAVPTIEGNEPWVDMYRFMNTCSNRYCKKIGFGSGNGVEMATDYSVVTLNCYR